MSADADDSVSDNAVSGNAVSNEVTAAFGAVANELPILSCSSSLAPSPSPSHSPASVVDSVQNRFTVNAALSDRQNIGMMDIETPSSTAETVSVVSLSVLLSKNYVMNREYRITFCSVMSCYIM